MNVPHLLRGTTIGKLAQTCTNHRAGSACTAEFGSASLRRLRVVLLVATLGLASMPVAAQVAGGSSSPAGGPTKSRVDSIGRVGGVVISELMFGLNHWDGNGFDDQYIECHYNAPLTDLPIELSGWSLQTQSGRMFVFPQGTVVPPDTFFYVRFGAYRIHGCSPCGDGYYGGPGDVVPTQAPAQPGAGQHLTTGTAGTAIADPFSALTGPCPGTLQICATWFDNNFLDPDRDFVVLRRSDGTIQDAVGYWSGTQRPFGALHSESAAAGEWSLSSFHLHTFWLGYADTGIARESYCSDTNRPTDWHDGMRVGPTPGKDNDANAGDARVTGLVVDMNGDAVVGASVAAHLPAGDVTSITDVDGVFVLEGLPAGSFEVSARAAGFLDGTMAVLFKSPHRSSNGLRIELQSPNSANSAEGVIGPMGGTLVGPGADPKWRLEFPPNAIAAPALVRVTEVAAEVASTSVSHFEAFKVPGTNVFRFAERLRAFHFEPEGLVFPANAQPLLISVYDGQPDASPGDSVTMIAISTGVASIEPPGQLVLGASGSLEVRASIPHFSEWGPIHPINQNGTVGGGFYQVGPMTTDYNGDGKSDAMDDVQSGSGRVCASGLCPGDAPKVNYRTEAEVTITDGSGWKAGVEAEAESGKLAKLILKAKLKGNYEYNSSSSQSDTIKVTIEMEVVLAYDLLVPEPPERPDMERKCAVVEWQIIKVATPGAGGIPMVFNPETQQWELESDVRMMVPIGICFTRDVVGHC